MGAITLRVGPTRNSQQAALNWASSYELSGAIAQLGEHLRGTQGVAGSSPASSTPASAGQITVGANAFRDRFGSYMERAAAGETFVVTRHGKPFVRLASAVAR